MKNSEPGTPILSEVMENNIERWGPKVAATARVSKARAMQTMRIIFAMDAVVSIKEVADHMSQIMVCRKCYAPHIAFPDGTVCVKCGGELERKAGLKYGEIEVQIQPAQPDGSGGTPSDEGASGDTLGPEGEGTEPGQPHEH